MTATVPTEPNATRAQGWTRARLGAVVSYTLRSCIGRKRWVGCLLPCAGAVMFGLLSHAINQPGAEAFARVSADGIFALVVPIVGLVIGDAVLGAEVRSGVLHFTWLTPTPLGLIVVGRWIGGAFAALAALVASCGLAAIVAGEPGSALALIIAVGAGVAAYVAVFIAIGCVARRAAVWSLAFIFLVERLLGTALSGIAQWSPMWEARAAFLARAPGVPSSLIRDGIPAGAAALVRLGLITVIALGVARWRISRLRFSGAAD